METAIDKTQSYNATRLGPPDSGTLAAFKTPRENRTPQQQQLLNQRLELEKRTGVAKGAIVGAIGQVLLDEDKAAQHGTREAVAGVAHNQARTSALATRGYGPDGQPMVPGQTFGAQAQNPQMRSPASAQNQSPSSDQNPRQGFALRQMPGGGFRGSSTVNGNPQQENFTTRDAALAFYGTAQPMAASGAAGIQMAQTDPSAAPRNAPQRPDPMGPAEPDTMGYGAMNPAPAEESAFMATPSQSMRPGTPLGSEALMRGRPNSGQPIPQPNSTAALSNYVAEMAGQQAGQPALRPPMIDGSDPAAGRPVAPMAAPQNMVQNRIADFQKPMEAGASMMPSTSQFASPTTKMKQTAKKMGNPRANAGTQEFFSSNDDYGF